MLPSASVDAEASRMRVLPSALGLMTAVGTRLGGLGRHSFHTEAPGTNGHNAGARCDTHKKSPSTNIHVYPLQPTWVSESSSLTANHGEVNGSEDSATSVPAQLGASQEQEGIGAINAFGGVKQSCSGREIRPIGSPTASRFCDFSRDMLPLTHVPDGGIEQQTISPSSARL